MVHKILILQGIWSTIPQGLATARSNVVTNASAARQTYDAQNYLGLLLFLTVTYCLLAEYCRNYNTQHSLLGMIKT